MFSSCPSSFIRGIRVRTRFHRGVIFASSLGGVCVIGSPASAQLATPQANGPASARTAAVAIVSTQPRVDGALDDPVWQSVQPLTGFIQRELREGQPVTERTEVRLLSDGTALYVGAWL